MASRFLSFLLELFSREFQFRPRIDGNRIELFREESMKLKRKVSYLFRGSVYFPNLFQLASTQLSKE